jgi:hypothetical protein
VPRRHDAYGVPVKLYSTMIVLSAVVLVLYDARRLWRIFVTNESVPRVERPAFYDRIPRWLQWTAKGALVGSVFVSSIAEMSAASAPATTSHSAADALEGVWKVTTFEVGARDATASRVPSPWLRTIVQGRTIAIRSATDSLVYCRRDTTPDPHSLSFACRGSHRGDLRWSRSGDVLQLAGTLDSTPVRVVATALHPADYALLRWRFHWIDDR